MKRNLIITGVLALTVGMFAFTAGEPTEIKELEIGEAAPSIDAKLPATDGKTHSLNDIKQENGLLVVFSCNTCPFVIATQDRYLELAKLCKEQKVGMVAVNSNAMQHDGVDSMEEMKKYAENAGYDFPYVLDKNAALADAFGATRTPHVFLFDKDMKLVYRGAIDDNTREAEAVTQTFLQNAVSNLISGETIDPNSPKSVGCGIKRAR
jgi:peroxiredoxin